MTFLLTSSFIRRSIFETTPSFTCSGKKELTMNVVFPILFSLRNGGAYFCSLCSKLVSFCIDNPFHFLVVEKRIKGANTDGCLASAPREFHPHAVLARPYLLPATPRHLNMVARSGCSCKGVSLSCLCVVARNAAKPASRPRVSRSLPGEVVAHRPYGSSQTDRIRLPYAGRELSARRSCQGASAAR